MINKYWFCVVVAVCFLSACASDRPALVIGGTAPGPSHFRAAVVSIDYTRGETRLHLADSRIITIRPSMQSWFGQQSFSQIAYERLYSPLGPTDRLDLYSGNNLVAIIGIGYMPIGPEFQAMGVEFHLKPGLSQHLPDSWSVIGLDGKAVNLSDTLEIPVGPVGGNWRLAIVHIRPGEPGIHQKIVDQRNMPVFDWIKYQKL